MQPSSPTSSDDLRAGLRPPQFGLRTLLVAVGLLCVFLAAAKWMSPAVVLVVLMLVFSVVAHIAGNALGTQLRDSGSQQLRVDGATPAHRLASSSDTSHDVKFAPPSRLTQRHSLGYIVWAFPAVGSVLIAIAGGYWLASVLGGKATLGRMSFGITAFAVIGGILGFLLGTFLKVLIGANLDACRHEEDPS